MTQQLTHQDKLKFLKCLTEQTRNDVYAKYSANAVGEKATYRLIKEPITDTVLAAHIDKKQPIGAYLLPPGKTDISFAVFDLDAHKSQIREESPEEIEIKKLSVRQAAKKLISEMQKCGLTPHSFRSGGGIGIHLWVFWEAPQPTRNIRALMQQILESLGFKDGTSGVESGEIEVFPKQNMVAEGKYGNLIALPFARLSRALHLETLDPIEEE